MSRSFRHLLSVSAAALACLVLAPVAQAGDHYGADRYGATGDVSWSSAEEICRQVEADATRCHWSESESRVEERRAVEDDRGRPALYEAVSLPGSFFDDTGGVGPAFVDYGGSSGGGVVFAGGGAFAGASAFASARASVSIGFRGGFHGGGFRPPMGHGCGCSGGHRW